VQVTAALEAVQDATPHEGRDHSMLLSIVVPPEADDKGGIYEVAVGELARGGPGLHEVRVLRRDELERAGLVYDPILRKPGPSPRDPSDVRLAFVILAGLDDPPWRIYRLVRSLWRPPTVHASEQADKGATFFYVHIDARFGDDPGAKVSELEDELAHGLNSGQGLPSNVRVGALFDIAWGGTAIVHAELAAAEELMRMGSSVWPYHTLKYTFTTFQFSRARACGLLLREASFCRRLGLPDQPLRLQRCGEKR